MFVYFIAPNPQINWWANEIPNFSWSLLSAVILLTGCLKNREQLSAIRFANINTTKWLGAFLFLSIIVSFFAVNQAESFRRCYNLFSYVVVVLFFVKCIRDERQFEYLILLLLLCGLVLGYYAYNMPRHGSRLEGVGTSDTNDANNLALLLATIIPFGLPVLVSNNKYLKYILPICYIFILNGIILCNSRGAIVAIVASFVMIILLLKIPKWRIIFLALGLLVGCVFAYLADDVFWARLKTLSDSAEEDRGSGRLDIWKEGLQMSVDYPLGTGGEGFRTLSPHYISDLTYTGVRVPHNTFLLILVEQGYLGLVIFCCLNINILIILRKGRNLILLRQEENQLEGSARFLYLTNIAINAALVGHLVGSIFGDRLYYEYYYYLIGMAISSYYLIVNMFSNDLINGENKQNILLRKSGIPKYVE